MDSRSESRVSLLCDVPYCWLGSRLTMTVLIRQCKNIPLLHDKVDSLSDVDPSSIFIKRIKARCTLLLEIVREVAALELNWDSLSLNERYNLAEKSCFTIMRAHGGSKLDEVACAVNP